MTLNNHVVITNYIGFVISTLEKMKQSRLLPASVTLYLTCIVVDLPGELFFNMLVVLFSFFPFPNYLLHVFGLIELTIFVLRWIVVVALQP